MFVTGSHVGVDDNNQNMNNVITPNPANEYIEIIFTINYNLSLSNDYIKIYNIYGENVLSFVINTSSPVQRIDISRLPDGLYYLRLANQVQKFIKLK
ncbi:T9SS C-terminal target domain-containing protein [Bacteroidetes/Chlorobi group bacterium ChocPot_Mid]|nr:MAG: T9SS C-terminal target domain-containing protein [Bacteroidetes/Chlorobi group bacterium ChocPot_Mid]